jgi:endonuclease/exonuclease/phosphatase (EEP) superfamily protein YafD
MATPTPPAPAPEPLAYAVRLRRGARAVANWFWTNVVVGAFGVWLVGQVFRDGHRVTALCLAAPSVLITAALLLTTLLAWLCTCRRVALAAAILWIPPACSVLFVENQWRRPKPPGNAEQRLRLVHWNVGGCQGEPDAILRQLQPQEADIYVLSELYDAAVVRKVTDGLGPAYAALHQQHHLTVIARGSAKLVKLKQRISNRAYFVEWTSEAGPLTLLLVDLKSRPIYYRGARLLQVRELIGTERPDLVVGDFNTTRRSRVLARLPRGYAHAYYRAGAGWSYTWPDEFPLWDLDQCIVGPAVQPLRYDLLRTGSSDHRMQVLDFSVAPAGAN